MSLHVAATPERAFEAFTQKIGIWWRPNPLFHFTPHSPGTLAFEPDLGGPFTETSGDGEVFEIGRIIAWEPGFRLVFTWRQATFTPEQITEVDVRFPPVDAETRVTVEHRGWDTVPQEHVARHTFPEPIFLRRHGEGGRSFCQPTGVAFQAASGPPEKVMTYVVARRGRTMRANNEKMDSGAAAISPALSLSQEVDRRRKVYVGTRADERAPQS